MRLSRNITKLYGIPDAPKAKEDSNENVEWTRLASHAWLTLRNKKVELQVGERIPFVIVKQDGLMETQYLETGLTISFVPAQANEKAVQLEDMLIKRRYLTNINWTEPLEFSVPCGVCNDFNIEISLVIPHNKCMAIQMPGGPKDYPIFAFLSAFVTNASEIYKPSQTVQRGADTGRRRGGAGN